MNKDLKVKEERKIYIFAKALSLIRFNDLINFNLILILIKILLKILLKSYLN